MTAKDADNPMIDERQSDDVELGALSRHIRVRLLNCSPNGCLLESHTPVIVGTVAVLQISVGDQMCRDVVQVVRCQVIAGTAGIHHLAARLLPTTPPYQGSLRHALRCESSQLASGPRDELRKG